jgi:SAM-dependent methyltransferase
MARPLVGYLGPRGSYDGFDVSAEGIAWCRRHYAGHPHFRFRHLDLYNRYYNPGGTGDAADVRFPYEDGSFDFVFLTSVVTHLTAQEARRYLGESRRVMARGGRLFVTFFMLDAEAERGMREGRAARTFDRVDSEVAVSDPEMPEAAVAYAAAWVRRTLADLGLSDVEVYPGSWSGRADATSYQDIVVARA